MSEKVWISCSENLITSSELSMNEYGKTLTWSFCYRRKDKMQQQIHRASLEKEQSLNFQSTLSLILFQVPFFEKLFVSSSILDLGTDPGSYDSNRYFEHFYDDLDLVLKTSEPVEILDNTISG